MSNIYQEFLKNIRSKELFSSSDKLLLGVSGGVDSVVLVDLIEQLGNEYAIAHCNFNLRGNESDSDERLVKQLAEHKGVDFHNVSFDTIDIAQQRGISIEMAARELRYTWFDELRVELAFDYIVVAHHLDDVLETFILNLSRGTGIRGLSGIKDKAGRIVRPLLFAKRNEIEKYAVANKLEWQHDSSNDDINIQRNKVRHEILPLLEDINAAFRSNLKRTIDILNDTEQIYLDQIRKVNQQFVKIDKETITIEIAGLRDLSPLPTYLFELLRPYGFNSEVVAEIIDSLESTSGNRFYSATHRLVRDREHLIITPVKEQTDELYYIDKSEKWVDQPVRMSFKLERYTELYTIPNDASIAVLDYDKLAFPLLIRKWRQGEYFKPLGMKNFKKLSDFFIDEKYSIPEKEKAWIIYSGKELVWIIGKRIDERFKLTKQTKLVLRIELKREGN